MRFFFGRRAPVLLHWEGDLGTYSKQDTGLRLRLCTHVRFVLRAPSPFYNQCFGLAERVLQSAFFCGSSASGNYLAFVSHFYILHGFSCFGF